MKELMSKYFGEVEYLDEDIVHFPVGLFGFEEEHSFLLLPFADAQGTMYSLQSIQTPALAFVAMDPFALDPLYDPHLQTAELEAMGVDDAGKLGYYVLCALKRPVAESTVNLRCPIVIDPVTRMARQVILEEGPYEMRHPLTEFHRKEGTTC